MVTMSRPFPHATRTIAEPPVSRGGFRTVLDHHIRSLLQKPGTSPVTGPLSLTELERPAVLKQTNAVLRCPRPKSGQLRAAETMGLVSNLVVRAMTMKMTIPTTTTRWETFPASETAETATATEDRRLASLMVIVAWISLQARAEAHKAKRLGQAPLRRAVTIASQRKRRFHLPLSASHALKACQLWPGAAALPRRQRA